MRKTTKKKIAPIAITVLLVAYLTPLIAIVLALAGFLGARDGLPALPFLLGYAFLGGAVVVGVILALNQRLREIDGGEEEEASQYPAPA